MNRSANGNKRQTLSNPNFVKKPSIRDEKRENKEKQENLQLVTFTQTEEDREDVPFIFKELPQSIDKLKALLEKFANSKSLVIKRLRDFYQPDAIKSAQESDFKNFEKFVLCLLSLWQEEQDSEVLQHL